jgi:hypothetical protein
MTISYPHDGDPLARHSVSPVELTRLVAAERRQRAAEVTIRWLNERLAKRTGQIEMWGDRRRAWIRRKGTTYALREGARVVPQPFPQGDASASDSATVGGGSDGAAAAPSAAPASARRSSTRARKRSEPTTTAAQEV